MNSNLHNDGYDVIVIGGGFYGCSVALFLRAYFNRILIIEREAELLSRASLVNQARVHNGYHYPRSYLTALRSYINFPSFVMDFRECIDSNFEKVYAVARNTSKVSALQFYKTFSNIGSPVKVAPKHIKSLFNSRLIEEVFSVKEYAFDAVKLGNILKRRLSLAQIDVLFNTSVDKVSQNKDGQLLISLNNAGDIRAKQVLNCTYAGINELLVKSGLLPLPMKYELTEIALIDVPGEIKGLGITVMDGPYFSTMPFPSRNLHSLSHVRYTPHEAWLYEDRQHNNHYLKPAVRESNALFMLKDAQRYLPSIGKSKHLDSLFEVKTILLQNEVDDGRPILFRENYGFKNHALIMGGKIDNIYDILTRLAQIDSLPKTAKALAS